MDKLTGIIGHREIVKTLRNAVDQGRVAHAYLFMGPPGVGKATAAAALAQALLCAEPRGGEACGCCRDCRQIAGGNHPDLHIIRPNGASIKIEQVRELQRLVQYKPYQAQRQVYLLHQVETMTAEAANSLLKTLEEPVGPVAFLLLSDQPYVLLPTILSRCQQLQFKPLAGAEVVRGLQLLAGMEADRAKVISGMAGGSLGRAMEMAREDVLWQERDRVLQMAGALAEAGRLTALSFVQELLDSKVGVPECLDLLTAWYRDLLIWYFTADEDLLVNRDRAAVIKSTAAQYEPGRLMEIIESIEEARGRLKSNGNSRLVLEVMMLKLVRAA